MSVRDFEFALEYVLKDEGGYWDDPSGGPTNFGITSKSLAKFRGVDSVSIDEIKSISKTDVDAFYFKTFWEPMRLSELNKITATVLFNVAVNMGQGAATKCAQLAINVNPDGVLGPNTFETLKNYPPKKFVVSFVSRIQDRYCDLVIARASLIPNIKGWIRRANRMITLILDT